MATIYHVVLCVWLQFSQLGWKIGKVVDCSLGSTEGSALQAVSSHLNKTAQTAAGTMGRVFLTDLKADMDSALCDAASVHKLQRQERGTRVAYTHAKQEMCGLEEMTPRPMR